MAHIKCLQEKIMSRYGFWMLFILRTAFYFFIIMALIFLYQYCEVGNSQFIYNEF